MSNIVEEAKRIPFGEAKKEVTADEIDLALSWLSGELQLKQIIKVLNKVSTSSMLMRVPYILREAYRQGKLEIKK